MGVVKSMNPNIKAHSFDNLLDMMVTADTRLDIYSINYQEGVIQKRRVRPTKLSVHLVWYYDDN